ncbi:hypothetical protein [Micromonospora cremea]|uniref:Uncharacterized protein n=1 Tax=Micromonospora cremea TaxID=709881 RepID=A0A1N5TEY1_9ACTN|nr:hypothetical protein [Micromonospora cremea]SIM46914.1 hypothetical protein SAMN04489832_0130 [Micromonospora cremea]
MTTDGEQQFFAEMFRHLDRIEPWLKRMDPDEGRTSALRNAAS